MALDEPKDSDAVFEVDGFTYLIDRRLLDEVRPVTVDFTTFGFRISANFDNLSRSCAV
jgi:hypothetical protein